MHHQRRVTSAGINPEHDDIWQAHQQLTRSGTGPPVQGSWSKPTLARPLSYTPPDTPPASKHLTDQTTPPSNPKHRQSHRLLDSIRRTSHFPL